GDVVIADLQGLELLHPRQSGEPGIGDVGADERQFLQVRQSLEVFEAAVTDRGIEVEGLQVLETGQVELSPRREGPGPEKIQALQFWQLRETPQITVVRTQPLVRKAHAPDLSATRVDGQLGQRFD